MTTAAPDPLLGATLGRYRILARIGEGGMGVVYRARDAALERDVALKVLKPEALSGGDSAALLLREARLASQLRHPNVCTIHEVGEDGGRHFVAMELVEGQPLPERIPPGGLPDETVARWGAALARALAHAHDRRVLHRDLKTANVVIGPEGRPVLLDFGLSRRFLDEVPPGAVTADAASGDSGIDGTPQYLAPEVLRGERANAASDLWSLGVVLYQMCAGRLPFGGPDGGPVYAAILHANPAPLPAHTGAGVRGVVARCLAKDPAQRYAGAGEVAAALEALLPGVHAPQRPHPRRARSRTALVAVALVGVAALMSWRFGLFGPRSGKAVLVLPLDVHGQVPDAEFAGRAFSEAMAVQLAQARGLHVIPVPAASETWPMGTLGRARGAQLAGADWLVVGTLAREGDSLRASVSLIDTRDDRVVWGEAHAASGGDLSLLASGFGPPLIRQLGAQPAMRYDDFMYGSGGGAAAGSPEMTEAVGAVRRYELPQSLDATERLVARFPRDADAHVLRVAALMIDLAARGPAAERSAAIEGELAALHALDPANPWADAARARLMPPGIAAAKRLGAVAARGDLTPAARGALLAMRADQLAAAGDTAAAIADAQRAVQLDPASDLSLSTLARVLSRAGRQRQAAVRVRQALALNPTVVNYWLQLGNGMLRLGERDAYIADLGRAAALSPDSDAVLSAQSDGLGCLGQYREAATCARRALARRPDEARYRLQLVAALVRTGAWSEAAAVLDRDGAPDASRSPLHRAVHAVVQARAGEDAEAAASVGAGAAALGGADARKTCAYALACRELARGDGDAALARLESFAGEGWCEPALDRDPNFAPLRPDARFQRIAAAMRAQPLEQVFRDWGRSR